MRTEKLKQKALVGLLATALGVGLAGPVPAADTSRSTGMERSAGSEANQRDMRASKVIGMKVRNPQDESLGKIDELIVDVTNERVAYAVLAFGGALGMGEKLFAYPVSLFQPASGRTDELVLNIDKDKLKSSPGFERKNWPDWNTGSYRQDVERYFGNRSMPNQQLARASELIGKNVDDRNGKHAGELKDLVVNLGSGKVHYAVLDFDKKWSLNDKLLPLSLKSFTFPEKRSKELTLNVARNDLDMSYGFDSNKWPDVGDPSYQRDIDRHLVRGMESRSTGQAGPLRE